MMRAPNAARVRVGEMASDDSYGPNGVFILTSPEPGWTLYVIASNEGGWDHCSVRAGRPLHPEVSRVPTWKEMCFVKDQFWEPEDCVVQYHPSQSAYINRHPHVLHLWRPTAQPFPLPPLEFV